MTIRQKNNRTKHMLNAAVSFLKNMDSFTDGFRGSCLPLH